MNVVDLDDDSKRDAACDHKASPELLRVLAKEPDGFFQITVAANPSTPVDVLEELSRSETPAVQNEVGSNPSAPDHVIRWMVTEHLLMPCIRIAERDDLSADLCGMLAKHYSPTVRSALAHNRATDPSVLSSMARYDGDEDVLLSLATNTSTPSETLERLASTAFWVKRRALGNPSLPVGYMEAVLYGDHSNDCSYLAGNPSLPSRLLRALVLDDNGAVARAASETFLVGRSYYSKAIYGFG